MSKSVMKRLKIFERSSTLQLITRLKRILPGLFKKVEKKASRLATWMAENIPEGSKVFDYPASRRKLLRGSNNIEMLHREIPRRARVVTIFQNEASC